jgi:hypothetical protein
MSRVKYNFSELEVGQTLTVPVTKAQSARSAACKYSKVNQGRKFTSRRNGTEVVIQRVS